MSHCDVQSDFKLVTLLRQPPECWLVGASHHTAVGSNFRIMKDINDKSNLYNCYLDILQNKGNNIFVIAWHKFSCLTHFKIRKYFEREKKVLVDSN